MTALSSSPEWSAPIRIHHALDGLAGFYASEAEAQAAVQELCVSHGLAPAQLMVLAPADARWLRFGRRARRWNRQMQPQRGVSDMASWTAAGQGALLAVVLAAVLLALTDLLTMEMQLVAVLLAGVTGALLGAGVATTLLRQQPQFKKFDAVIRHRLAAGEWAVVAHGVPWKRQSGVVSLMSRGSRNWCAISSEQGRL